MENYSNSKVNDEKKCIVLTTENKKELDEIINTQIDTLIEFQRNINENYKDTIDFNHVKDTVFKTEYFLFKLKSILCRRRNAWVK
jgi:hypothetical protein